jgi:hypothetical protein
VPLSAESRLKIHESAPNPFATKIIVISWKSLLTVLLCWLYNPLIERGRRAAGANGSPLWNETELRKRILSEIREKRKLPHWVWDRKATDPRYLFRLLFPYGDDVFGQIDVPFRCVRSLKIAYRRKRNVGGRVTASVWGETFECFEDFSRTRFEWDNYSRKLRK